MNRLPIVVASLALAVCGAGRLMAEMPPDGLLRLDQVVQQALASNPELAVARFEAEAARARAAKAGTLPNPMLSFSIMDRTSGGDWPDTEEKRIMLEQTFPWFGKRDLQRNVAAREAEGALHASRSAELGIQRRIKETFVELHAVRKAIDTTREEEKVLQSIVDIAQSLYATGARSQSDVFSIESETTVLKQKIIELEAREKSLVATLNALLDRPADTPVGPLAPPPEVVVPDDLDARLAGASRSRPEVLARLAMADRAAANQKLMAKESRPDYQLGVEYRKLGMDEDMAMLTLGIDLPIRRASIRAGIREAELMREAGLAGAKAAERAADLEIRNAAIALQSAYRKLELTRKELVPQAEARFKANEAAYRTGKSDFAEFLASQRFLLSAKVDEAMTAAEVGKQAARLEEASGLDLTSLNPAPRTPNPEP